MVVRARDAKILMESENCQLVNSSCYPLARHEKDISILYRHKWIYWERLYGENGH